MVLSRTGTLEILPLGESPLRLTDDRSRVSYSGLLRISDAQYNDVTSAPFAIGDLVPNLSVREDAGRQRRPS